MSDTDEANLRALIEAVKESPKYHEVHTDLIANIGKRELTKGRRLKEAVKATKNKLHQIGGAYLDGKVHYKDWLGELIQARDQSDPLEMRRTCESIMDQHASTRERLPILESFYKSIFSHLPNISSVLDVACGFNPLAIPWMPLNPDTHYTACDVYIDMVKFVHQALMLMPVQGEAIACDLISTPPRKAVDLALILKALPTLEQVDKSAGENLLRSLNAKYLVISYPLQSLGKREKGMRITYEAHYQNLGVDSMETLGRLEFENELVFVARKG